MQIELNDAPRVVLDTNTVVSGYLWSGSPNRIIQLGRVKRIKLYTSEHLIAELDRIARRDKFMDQLDRLNTTVAMMVSDYRTSATIVVPASIPRIVPFDPDDDAVLACAKAAEADYIVTGDPHLLRLGSYEGIPIVTVHQLLALFPTERE